MPLTDDELQHLRHDIKGLLNVLALGLDLLEKPHIPTERKQACIERSRKVIAKAVARLDGTRKEK